MSDLDEVVERRIAHFRPAGLPPFSRIRARRRRRLVSRVAGAALALIAGGGFALSALSQVDILRDEQEPEVASSSGPHVLVPQELAEPAGVPPVLPRIAPAGYTYDSVTATAVDGVAQSRSVLLRPARLADEPTVVLCTDRSPQQRQCPTGPGTLLRTVDGVSVRIALRGENIAGAIPFWRSVELTTHPSSSSLFRDDAG